MITKFLLAVLLIWMSIKVLWTMETKSVKIVLTPHPVAETLPISAMKLIESKQQVLFVFSTAMKSSVGGTDYHTVISSIPFEAAQQTPSQLFSVRQLLPPPPV